MRPAEFLGRPGTAQAYAGARRSEFLVMFGSAPSSDLTHNQTYARAPQCLEHKLELFEEF